MFRRCAISITIQYPAVQNEVFYDDAASAELAIEDKAIPLLMELFGAPLYVEDVTVEFSVPDTQYDDKFLFLP